MRMNPSEFYGSKSDEDPRLFLEKVRKITQAAYRLKDLAYDWVVS